jgi:hypothetical protein
MFFDVQNLMEVAVRFAGCTLEPGTSPVRLTELAPRVTNGGRVVGQAPATGPRSWPRTRGGLEEEAEAQEGQGVGVRKRATALRTDSTEKAPKVAASKMAREIWCPQRHREDTRRRSRRNIKGAKAPGDRGAHGGSGEFFEGW